MAPKARPAVPARVSDALGRVTRTYYDALNRTVAMVQNLTGQTITVTVVPAYSASFPDRNVRAFTSYDAAGRVLDQTDNAGLVTRASYDLLGRTITTTVNFVSGGPANATTNIAAGSTYDKLGNLTRSTDPRGLITAFDYDWASRVITVTENFVSAGATTVSQNVRTGYGYDGRGNRLTIRDGRGNTTTFTYDGLDRQRTERDALNNTWTTNYSKVGLVLSVLDAKGQTVGYAYDGLRRQTFIDYPAGTADVTFTYDALGNQRTMLDGTGTTTWALDALNRPVTITAPSGAVRYGYDRLGNRLNLVYPDAKAVTYTVDGLNRMATVQDWSSQTTSYSYNAFGQVVTTTLPGGLATVYGYDTAQRLQTLTHAMRGNPLGQYVYVVDAAGNRTAVSESGPNVLDTLFANGFESTNATTNWGWSARSGTGVAITTTTPITGTQSLLITPSGTTAQYVQDNTPNAEPRYRARFYLNTAALSLPTTLTHTVFSLYAGASTAIATVQIAKASGSDYQLRVTGTLDSATVQNSAWITITNGVHYVELDWQSALAAGANNGRVDWWVDGTARTGLTGLDNDTRRADMTRLGIVAVTGTGTATGQYRFDAFESRRGTGPIGASGALPDGLFADNLESGNANYWTAASAISVTAGAALVGTRGISVSVPLTTTARYVEDATPDNETSYRARFYLDPNTVTMTNGTAHLVFVGYNTNSSTDVFRLELQKVAAGYQLRTQIRDNASVWASSTWVTISDDRHALELAWSASASGKIDWWIDGVSQPATPVTNNSTRRLDLVRLGAVAGLDASTNGAECDRDFSASE